MSELLLYVKICTFCTLRRYRGKLTNRVNGGGSVAAEYCFCLGVMQKSGDAATHPLHEEENFLLTFLSSNIFPVSTHNLLKFLLIVSVYRLAMVYTALTSTAIKSDCYKQ
jgi:hypothetical protein